jgi:hypothetical protein
MVEWRGEKAVVAVYVRKAALRDGIKDQKSRSLSGQIETKICSP